MMANKRSQVTSSRIFTSHLFLSTLLYQLKIHLTKMTGKPMLSSLLKLGRKCRLWEMTSWSLTLRGLPRQLRVKHAMLFFSRLTKLVPSLRVLKLLKCLRRLVGV
nr:uncharacterized protein LOC107031429 isoform X2 [Ipomoea batatas]